MGFITTAPKTTLIGISISKVGEKLLCCRHIRYVGTTTKILYILFQKYAMQYLLFLIAALKLHCSRKTLHSVMVPSAGHSLNECQGDSHKNKNTNTQFLQEVCLTDGWPRQHYVTMLRKDHTSILTKKVLGKSGNCWSALQAPTAPIRAAKCAM